MLRLTSSRLSLRLGGNFSRNNTVAQAASLLNFRTSSTSSNPSDIDAKLREDVESLGRILGNSIQQQNPKVFEAVEKLRRLGREWRRDGDNSTAFQEMVGNVKTYDSDMLLGIARSFSNFLALANTAENHHRIRRLRDQLITSGTSYGLWTKNDSSVGTIQNLLKQGTTKEDIFNALSNQRVEIVLTAHPTEVNRRTMLRKHGDIKKVLGQLDRPDLTTFEKKSFRKELESQIQSIWESDNLRRKKPSPVDEAKYGLAIVETVLWEAVPNFLRKLDDLSQGELQQPLSLRAAPLKLASWMGGDRDGNPNVTPEITREVSLLCRWMAATLYKEDLATLRNSISVRPCSDAVRQLAGGDSREPYRAIIKQLEARIQATIDWTEDVLIKGEPYVKNIHVSEGQAKPIFHANELLDPLVTIHESLVQNGLSAVADSKLVDTIRRVAVFGVSLLQLDIRQESTRHTEALDAITRHLGLGSYAQWDEETRRTWLQSELSSKRPLLARTVDYTALGFSSTVVDTLRTFDTIASLHDESLGAYVISQCQQASDVLAVALLQKDAGVHRSLRVVPLFETLDDLQRAPATIDALFSMSTYRGRINNKHEIMVGYSDSAKDAGRLAASWELYNSQTTMMEVGKKYGVELTFFHGKGGTVGRGGNPALFDAILAHPPNTIQGRFRITEQGEMITQNLGDVAVAERTLDLFTAGVLAEQFFQRPTVKPEWKDTMERMATSSCEVYRQVVRGEPRFVQYFRSATPEQDLAGLNVGSRPAKRNPKGGVESLRAIPWVFAWTQTRLNLPTWLGVGEALTKEMERDAKNLQQMFDEWPWFRTLIDLLEMVAAKSEVRIAENYDQQLVKDTNSLQLGKELREKLSTTSQAILQVSRSPFLQAHNTMLIRSLAVRNPYIDPLNIIQAELLKRLRAAEEENGNHQMTEEEKATLRDALMITINGIANGMRNSG